VYLMTLGTKQPTRQHTLLPYLPRYKMWLEPE